MSFEAEAAVSAGLIGGAAMALILYMGIAMAPDQMRMNLFHILGTMNLPRGSDTAVYMLGAMVHAVMAIVFGLIHAAVFSMFGEGTNLVGWGALFGLVHWVIVGGSLYGMGYLHPLMRSGDIDKPGPFAISYPKPTAVGFLMLHLVYGMIVGGLYTVFV